LYGGYEGLKALGIVNADGSRPHLVDTPGEGIRGRVVWSPDGSTILYADAWHSVASVPPSGGASRQLYWNPDRYPLEPDWSPDGREIVFSESSAVPNTTRRIFVVSLESGSAVRQLIPEAVRPRVATYNDTEPAWSRTRK
jgi:Tol biopolymer transport system component